MNIIVFQRFFQTTAKMLSILNFSFFSIFSQIEKELKLTRLKYQVGKKRFKKQKGTKNL
jgi:DNA invertase Pin-like site-specific DNA recombinase